MPDTNGFTMPSALAVDESTATDRYAKFIAEPFEKGFGHTLGNAMRRVLLSSMEGVAAATVRIDGVPHEFTTIDNVVEDVTEVILNLKMVKFKCDGNLPRTLELYAEKAGPITAAAIREDGVTEVLNKSQLICNLDQDRPLRMEIEIDRGRGYRAAELNKRDEQPIGVIPMDCLFSPVERVRYDIHACRVGQRTDYDQLVLEVWTDGRISPEDAVRKSSAILQEHLTVFVQSGRDEELTEVTLTEEEEAFVDRLCRSVNDLNLSVRARNCLRNANIESLGELVQKSEAEMLKYRNFGKKSLDEIKEKLLEMDISLEMDIPEHLVKVLDQRIEKVGDEAETSSDAGVVDADDSEDEEDVVVVEEKE